MNVAQSKKDYPYYIGPLIILLSISIYKTVSIASVTSIHWLSPVLKLMRADIPVIATTVVVLCIASFCRGTLLQTICLTATYLLLVLFALDCFLILNFDTRFDWEELFSLLPPWSIIVSFIDWKLLAIIFFALLLCRFRLKMKRTSVLVCLFSALSIHALHCLYPPSLATTFERYSYSIFAALLRPVHATQIAEEYSKEDISFYGAMISASDTLFQIPNGKPNIILLLIESLSARDSKKIAQIKDKLAILDRMASDGIYFTNFFANGPTSDAGLVALLNAQFLLPPPGGKSHIYTAFAHAPSVVKQLNESGYFTELLTTVDLRFAQAKRYYKATGFQLYQGRDEVQSFKNAPRFAFAAPADDVLYAEALNQINRMSRLAKAHFLVLLTASTHPPQTRPYGTQKETWQWAQEELEKFYLQLQATKFFENGILIISSDHRKMERLAKKEVKRFGASAVARIPLLVIGKNIPPNVIDERFFQQADLFPKFHLIANPNEPLSPNPIFREQTSWRPYTNVNAGYFSVFPEGQKGFRGYRGFVLGTQLNWLNEKPSSYHLIEQQIHAKRALMQSLN